MRVVRDAGLNPAFISFSPKAINSWQGILEYAMNQEMVGDVIARAIEENPKNEALKLAQQNKLLVIESPDIDDADWSGPTDDDQLEKLMGAMSTLRPINFLARGLEVSKSVARVAFADGSSGSGFLIQDNLLITNHHVLASEADALKATVEFNYQKTPQGLDAPIKRYELAPDEAFATSPEEKAGGDDWTVVRVKGDPNAKWGALPLAKAEPQVKDEVIIIQHPAGGPKQIALTHNVVAFVNERRLQYLTDTLEGSSGSPVFDMDWKVVALHHAGGWLREPGTKQAVFRNQGVHINVVIDGLTAAGLL
jgi:V8-like Glu-specific endopeptidase